MPTAYMWHQHHIVELAARGGQLMTRDGLSQQVPGIIQQYRYTFEKAQQLCFAGATAVGVVGISCLFF